MPPAGTSASGTRGGQLEDDAESLRLLFAVPFGPRRDVKHGGRVVTQFLLRLVRRHRVAVVYLKRPAARPIEQALADQCELVHEVQTKGRGLAVSPWRHRFDVLASPLTGIPSPVAPLRSREFASACIDIAQRWNPDVVQVEHETIAYCGLALRDSGSAARRILVSHEPGMVASEDQGSVTSSRQRLSHRFDVATWRRYWARTLPAFHAIVAFTDRDRHAIERHVDGPHVATIGLGIDIPDRPLSGTGIGEGGVLFIGGYQHPPNTDAALRLVRSIMPAVRRRLPGLPLLLVGADPGRELRDAAGAHDIVTGTVPKVAPHLDEASLVVLPIRLGGGMRVKLLEALAAGKAVVASPLAAAGLDVTNGEELVLATSDEEFARSIVALVADRAARERLGERARQWAARNLSWDSRVSEYERLYRSLLGSRLR